MAAAQRWLDLRPREEAAPIGDGSLNLETLQQLEESLRDNNLRALVLFEQLQPQLGNRLSATSLENLTKAIQQLDFHKALEVVRVISQDVAH